jgi:protein-S-isoprenylcysteine O-methyltransferase Ste14
MELIPALKIGLWNAWIFMSVFILQMLFIMSAGSSVRRRSHVPANAIRKRNEQLTALIANIVWLATLILSIFLPLKTGTVWFIAGFLLFLAGSALMALSTYNFIHTPINRLITAGAYKCSRNPMYLASVFICLGSGIAAGSWIFIILTAVMGICFHYEVLFEEQYCRAEYGDDYPEYFRRVPRWIGLPKRI